MNQILSSNKNLRDFNEVYCRKLIKLFCNVTIVCEKCVMTEYVLVSSELGGLSKTSAVHILDEKKKLEDGHFVVMQMDFIVLIY